MRRRIPFTKQLLLFTFKIADKHKSVYWIALLGAIIQTIWSVYWSFTSVAIYNQYEGGTLIGIMVFVIFSFYWTSRVLRYIFVHTDTH